MAYLNKRQYEYRENAAAERNFKNGEIAMENGMTEEQADLIKELCSLRHELHTNMDALVKGNDNNRIEKRLIRLNDEIRQSGLTPISCIPAYEGEFIDIDSIEMLTDDAYSEYCDYEIPESGTKEWQDWYDREYYRIYDEWSEIHEGIENYLREIDNQYGTKFCPTGALRIY